MAYDPIEERIVVFGGTTLFGSGSRADTWAWDGEAWTELTPNPSPPKRGRMGMVYDALRNQFVAFGGADSFLLSGFDLESTPILGDTWIFEDGRWSEAAPEANRALPSPRRRHAMAYDPDRRQTILVSGLADQEQRMFEIPESDTWAWNGANWTLVDAFGNPPRQNHGMAFDTLRRRIVVNGGSNPSFSLMFDWDGTEWRERMPFSSAAGPPTGGHPLAYDTARDRLVVYNSRGTVHEWSNDAWTASTVPGAPRRNGTSLVYDEARRRVMLWGGISAGNPVSAAQFEWDGSTWTDRTPAPGDLAPPADRVNLPMVYNPHREKVVLLSGGRVWEWDGTTWLDATPTVRPTTYPIRSDAAASYDIHRRRVVLFGGAVGGVSNDELRNDTWELISPTQPAAQAAFQLPADLEPDQIDGIRVRAYCGGTTTGTVGAALWGWLNGRAMGPQTQPDGLWTLLDQGDAGLPFSSEEGRLEYRPTGETAGDAARRFLFRDRQMFFQCRPRGSSSVGFARVGLDYLEVRVLYRP